MVKKLRSALEEKRVLEGSNIEETKWMKAIPKKICVFVWRVRLGRIPSRVVLDSMGMELDSTLCPRCDKEIESVDHALIKCEEVKKLWLQTGRWWDLNLDSVSSLSDLFGVVEQLGDNEKGARRWVAVVWCFLYLVWANRNKVVFEKDWGIISDRFFKL